jgi:hypothetical protein
MVTMSILREFVLFLANMLRNPFVILKKLDLTDSHPVGDRESRHLLFDSLGENTSLCHLSLSECNLRGESLSRTFTNLSQHPSMTHLYVSFNKPDCSAIFDLSRLLKRSQALVNLNLGFIAFGSGRQKSTCFLFPLSK